LVLQKQHGRPAAWGEIARWLGREMPLGLALGAACGALVGLFAWLWRAGVATSLSIFASIALGVMFAATFGILVPLLLHKLQRDPKVAAGPITLAMTDIVALTLYLANGALWLLP
jgi:magnesium transporter